MQALVDVILPVFLLIGAGYAAAVSRVIAAPGIDGLMRYANSIAAPCLLMLAISRIDLGTAWSPDLLISFYVGAFASFAVVATGAVVWLRRPAPDAVVIGFAALFSNTLLLGLPITERAYGSGALTANYILISVHSPLLFGFGITLMEVVLARAQGLHPLRMAARVVRGIATQPLLIGIAAGFALNLGRVTLPAPVQEAAEMIASTAIPVALFGLGGVLWRYRPEGDARAIALICAGSLGLHPMLTWWLGTGFYHLDTASLRSAVVTAAMAPGVNAYLFAHFYGAGQRVTASAVLIATGLSLFTAWGWLRVLP
jgi:hypothetical protein